MSESEDNEFYICLPTGPGMNNIPNLLRWGAKQLRADQKERGPLYLALCVITIDGQTKPSFYANYWIKEADEIETSNEIKAATVLDQAASVCKEVEYKVDPATDPILNSVSCRLPRGDKQDDAVALLERTADVLDGLGDVEITDVVFHDAVDDNGVDHPVLRAYYTPILPRPRPDHYPEAEMLIFRNNTDWHLGDNGIDVMTGNDERVVDLRNDCVVKGVKNLGSTVEVSMLKKANHSKSKITDIGDWLILEIKGCKLLEVSDVNDENVFEGIYDITESQLNICIGEGSIFAQGNGLAVSLIHRKAM